MAADYIRTSLLGWRGYKSWSRAGDNDSLSLGVSDSFLYHPKGRKLDTPELAFIEPAHAGKKAQAVLVKNVRHPDGTVTRELYAVELSLKAMWKMFMQLAIELKNAER